MKILISLFLCTICLNIFSQDTIAIKKRKLEIQNKIVLVVPFNPTLYSNDASKEMIEQSGLKYKQVQNLLRIELDKSLHKAIADSCRSKGLLESFTTGGDNELDMIYSYSDYFFSEAMSYNPDRKPLSDKSKLAIDKDDDPKKKKKKKKKDEEETPDIRSGGDLRSEVKNNSNKFFNVKFREKDFLKNYSKKDNIDYFLFINQFEIKGDYSDPYKAGNNSYAREIKIHFSIFNHDGEYLYGSFATIEFPAKINDPEKLAKNYFMKLAREVVKNIPF